MTARWRVWQKGAVHDRVENETSFAVGSGRFRSCGKFAESARSGPARVTLSTTAFEDGGIIPDKYTAAAGAATVSPKLMWTHVPNGVVTFVLLEHDPDTSVNKTSAEILHWMMFNIPGATHE